LAFQSDRRRIDSDALNGFSPLQLSTSAGADHRVTVVSEPWFDPEMSRLKDVATAAG
jgi:hypothetical protein